MDLQPVDFVSGLGHLPDPIGTMQKEISDRLGLAEQAAQTQGLQAQAAAIAQKVSRAQQFQEDLGAVKGDPNASAVSSLIMKYPEFADQLKAGWDVKDKAARDADLTQMGELYSAAASGNWDLALKQAQARVDADTAAGQADPSDQAFVDQIQAAANGDDNAKKGVLTSIGTHLAAVTGPEHFGSVYGALKGDYTLDPGAVRLDANGNIVGHSPLIKGDDGALYDWNSVMGGDHEAAAATTPDAHPSAAPAAVATTLAESGIPDPVVAGFLGNFHVEGGYSGAKGDGGSAKGIAQWHDDRLANFAQVVGKPLSEATPTDQAKFVVWEMQNPEAAGMTVKQRDAILQAKTPAQAAALIDQYYERSSGKDRSQRVAAANGFAGVATDGAVGATGPKPLVPGRDSPDQYRTLTPDEVKRRGLDPAQQYQLNSRNGQVSSLGKIDASDQPIPGDSSLSGPAYLATVPPNLATQVKALAEGRLPMPSSFALAKPYWQKLLQMTAQYDPTFDAATAAARKSAITAFTGNGKAAQVVGSVNRVANHLNTLWEKSQKLAGPDLGNSTLNSLAAAAGQSFDPADARAYDTAVGFVAGELEKIARNSPGTEAGVERVVNNLSRKQSTKTRNEAIKTAVDIISGAIDPLKDQYNSAFPNDAARPNIPWVSPRAQAVYRKLGADLSLTGANADTNKSNDSGPVSVASPADAAKLPSGTLFRTPDGRILRKK